MSPGRQAAGKRLHELNLAGLGGHRPKHGRRALAELLKRGLEEGTPIHAIERELSGQYLADLGGEANISAMDRGLVKRLVASDLDLALLAAHRDRAAKFTREQTIHLSSAMARNSAAYAQLVKTLGGPARRAAERDGEILVRRYAADSSERSPNTEQPASAAAPERNGDA